MDAHDRKFRESKLHTTASVNYLMNWFKVMFGLEEKAEALYVLAPLSNGTAFCRENF